jgi:hypothetical protein
LITEHGFGFNYLFFLFCRGKRASSVNGDILPEEPKPRLDSGQESQKKTARGKIPRRS